VPIWPTPLTTTLAPLRITTARHPWALAIENHTTRCEGRPEETP
jgi:hypothetical protein